MTSDCVTRSQWVFMSIKKTTQYAMQIIYSKGLKGRFLDFSLPSPPPAGDTIRGYFRNAPIIQ